MQYSDDNIFAKILRQEIPCRLIGESPYHVAFHDIAPQANIHALVIPKGRYLNFDAFAQYASVDEKIGFEQGILETLNALDLMESGYRLITNSGINGGQQVPHYHVHILAGERISEKLNNKTHTPES